MGWKSTARSIPASHMLAKLEEAALKNPQSFYKKSIVIRYGKPWVTRDHILDFTDEDEDGKYVAASSPMKQGDYIFPKAYIHIARRFVGSTKDIRLREDGSWDVYLDAVLGDSSGKPVLHDGQEIDLSGWFHESKLMDAGFGKIPIRSGASLPSIEDMQAARDERRRNRG